jgi:TetR/AcrR family transcriptional regulator, transcriptional repressor for nem operon
MKVSREQAAENGERILELAARLLRERGIDGVSVADLMKSAGLTHGGFYGHFKSKQQLVAQACGLAISRMRQSWMKSISEMPDNPIQAIANRYLTAAHRDHSGRGCPMAAIGTEIARQGPLVRHTVTEELRLFLDSLARALPASSESDRRQKAMSVYALLVGGLVLARAVDDPAFSNEILQAAAASLPRESTSNHQL